MNDAECAGSEVKSIFSSIFEYGDLRSKKENYLTAGLVFILQSLLESGSGYKEFGVGMLNYLLGDKVDFSFSSGEDIDIQAQRIYPESEGVRMIPDITIEPQDKKDKLVYIENKVSPLNDDGIDRLRRYRDTLDRKREGGIKTSLVLITPSGQEDHRRLADRQVSWLSVGKELEKLYYGLNQSESTKESMVMAYLIKSLKEFIEEEIMYVGRVEGEINKLEMYKLVTLLKIIEKACKDAGLMRLRLESELYHQKDDSWIGYRCNGGKYAVGVYVEDPRKVYLEIHEENEVREKFKDKEQVHKLFGPDADLWENRTILGVPLDLSNDFFALTQGEEQAGFIRKSIVEALQKMEQA